MRNIRFIVGLSQNKKDHTVNGVRYIVESRFEPNKSDIKFTERMSRCITNDFAPLTVLTSDSTMEADYVCSAAGKED